MHSFDMQALEAALDEQRRACGLTWEQLTAEINPLPRHALDPDQPRHDQKDVAEEIGNQRCRSPAFAMA